MDEQALKKLLIDHFSTPFRYGQLSSHAETIIKNTPYPNITKLLKFLKNNNILKAYKKSAKNGKHVTLYTSSPLEDISPYIVAKAMFPDSYFCNLTSIFYHLLTNQIPNTVYICNETISERIQKKTHPLNNNKLRSAFVSPSRTTQYVFEQNKYKIVVVDRVKNSDHGVISTKESKFIHFDHSRITCLERALIDAVVTPQYNGGITSVCSYFKSAKPNIDKLIKIYQQLNLTYPYAQAIGFIFDRHGLEQEASSMYKTFPPKLKFYADHHAKSNWEYDEKWKLFYPKGIVDEN